jgi:hypothetical protein
MYIPFPKGFSYTAINIFGCFLINSRYKDEMESRPAVYDRLIRHESIHTRQGSELLWVFFYLFYVLEFLVRLVQYRNWKNAYKNISFEREAYLNDGDNGYLVNRKRFAFIRYIRLQTF